MEGLQWEFFVQRNKRLSDRYNELFEYLGAGAQRNILYMRVCKGALSRESCWELNTSKRSVVVKESTFSVSPLFFFPLRATFFKTSIASFTRSMAKVGEDNEARVRKNNGEGNSMIMGADKEAI